MSLTSITKYGTTPDLPLYVAEVQGSNSETSYVITENGPQTAINVSNSPCLSIQIQGTFNVDLSFETSNDQSNWVPVEVRDIETNTEVSTVNSLEAPINNIYRYSSEGCYFRVVAADYVSGTANVTICSSASGCSTGLVTATGGLTNFTLAGSGLIREGTTVYDPKDLTDLYTCATLQVLADGDFTSLDLVVKGSINNIDFVEIRRFNDLTPDDVNNCFLELGPCLPIRYVQVCIENVVVDFGFTGSVISNWIP
jgi:hypothetical protein